jgi:hypothetical protein
MSQNIGTLVTAAIRPNDSLDLIASAWSNEIKGGHHNYETLAERDSLILARREWGMLVTVYDDPISSSNNKTYQLKYNWSNTTITDNNNWVIYNPGSDTPTTTEWVDSVKSVVTSPTSSNNGDRYLISIGAGAFAGNDYKIATYDVALSSGSGGWVFTTPIDGTTVKVDDQSNVLFKYEGSYSAGIWVKEYLNQVRYINPTSINGLSYSYTSTEQDAIDSYSYSVYYASFGMTNSGAVQLSIDSLSQIEVKKVSNGSLISLSAGDITPGIEYQLVVNGSYLQTSLLTSTNVIGSAEDGDYNDGLYTDFTINTPIGTAIDRFNEVLLALVPPPAPGLTSWSATGSFVNGKLSFDNSNSILISATGSPYGSVAKGETFSASGYRLGITSKVSQPLTGNTFYQDISGILNSSIAQYASTPTPSYATYSFGNATVGTVSLIFNGVTLSSIGLSSTHSSYDTTTSGATSGLVITAATSSKFLSGYPFENFWNRTGTYLIKKDSPNMADGYNYIIIRHDLPTTSYVLNRYEFVADSSTASTTFTNPQISNRYTSGTKYLSGIKYYNSYGLKYLVQINNLYGNTFNFSTNAITFGDPSGTVSNGVYGSGINTNSSYPIFSPSPTSSTHISIPSSPSSNWTTPGTGWAFSTNPNVRRINNSLSFNTTVLRTVQGTVTGGTATSIAYSIDNWFIDTFGTSSTNLVENFDDETYRLINLNDKYNTTDYNLLPISTTTYGWSSSVSLRTNADHKNGLQVINGHLIYPDFDFNTIGTTNSNPNYNPSNTSIAYTNCGAISSQVGHGTMSGVTSQYRTYTRYFNVGTALNYPTLTLKLTHVGCSPVNANVALNNNTNIWVEFKLPYDSSTGTPTGGTAWGYGGSTSTTGWLDATKPFVSSPESYADGVGCLSGSIPTSGNPWIINFGHQGTQWSSGWVLMRITAGKDWKGYIDKIEISVP